MYLLMCVSLFTQNTPSFVYSAVVEIDALIM